MACRDPLQLKGLLLKESFNSSRLRPSSSRPPDQPRRSHRLLLAPNQLRLLPCLRVCLHASFHARSPVHPLIQPALAETPTVPQPERRDKPRGCIAIQTVGADAQIMGRLANVHYFPNFRRCGCGFHRGSSRYWEAMYTTPPQPKETPNCQGNRIANPTRPAKTAETDGADLKKHLKLRLQ